MVVSHLPHRFARLMRPRTLAWLLAVAYLPSVTFFGHWDLHIDVPGTNVYVGFVAAHEAGAATHTHTHNASTGDPAQDEHARHCHAGPAECGDAPVISTATVALLARSLEEAPELRSLLPPPADGATPGPGQVFAPEPPPPRA